MRVTLPRMLIAEDDRNFADTLRLEFSDRGYDVQVVHSLSEFNNLAEFRAGAYSQIDYAVVDMKLGTDNGIDLVEALHQRFPACQIVMLTGYGSIATAIKAVKLGATNYLTKPASASQIEAALRAGETAPGNETPDSQAPSLARHEREYIESVLSDCNGNISQAARVLGLHRQSLQRKLRKFSPP